MMKVAFVICALLALSVDKVSATKASNCVPTLQKACGKAFAGLVNQYPALVQLLSTPNERFTVLCPSDWALKKAKIPQGLAIEDLLKYHIIPGVSIRSKDLVKSSPLTTAFQGKKLTAVKKWHKSIQILADLSKAYVIKADATYGKIRIHKIDAVLIPSTSVQTCKTVWAQLVASPDLSVLKAAVEAAGLVSALNDPNLVSTVFAPTNKAFADLLVALKTDLPSLVANKNLLLAVLKNHVVPGAAVRSNQISDGQRFTTLDSKILIANVNKYGVFVKSEFAPTSAKVVYADITACKSVVHAIDAVLVPVAPPSPPPVATCKTVWAQLVASPDLSVLKAAVEAAGLVSALNDPNLVSTVFAPTNAAVAQLLVDLKTDLPSLVANKNLLLAVLKNHVVPGAAVRANQISDGQRFTTLDSKILIANVNHKGVFVKSEFAPYSYKVVYANIVACKSIVHAINGVLVPVPPPSPPPPVATCKTVWAQLVASPDLSVLKAAVEAAGLVPALNDPNLVSTVFAPTNKAFAALLVALKTDLPSLVANKDLLLAVLKNHVVPGAAVRSNQISDGQRFTTLDSKILIANVNKYGVFVKSEFAPTSAKVVYADITACKSVVHAIDAVLVPVAPPSPPPPVAACTTIWAAVCATPDLSVLKAAIEAAGLVSTLNDPNLVSTVFAPTNSAFAALLVALKTDLPSLVANKNLLLAVLKNHVVPGVAVRSNQISDGQRFTTLDSKILIANVNNYGVFVKSEFAPTSAKVVLADVATCKSIVHVINAVLVPVAPPSPPPPVATCTTIWAAVAGNPEFSALKAAIEAAGLVSTLNDPGLVATVFAPNNAAFAALLVELKTDLASLVANKDLLVAVLKNHVVPGAAVLGKDITDNQLLKTLGDKYLIANLPYGGGVTIKSKGSDKVYKVITADVIACKSVVHFINGVLIPAY